MSGVIEEHRLYLRDRHRVSAYQRALSSLVHPGSVVVDLASGTGILGMLACRAGASRVYAIERGSIAGLAAEIARANGFDGIIVGVRGASRSATIPERADLAVCDQMGPFGIDAGILDGSQDARARFLRPGGVFVPAALDLVLAAVEDETVHRRVAFWRSRPAGFDCSPVAPVAENSPFRVSLRATALLSAPAIGAQVDLTRDTPLPLRLAATLTAARDGLLHGIGGWFVAHLAPEVTMTNAPDARDRIRRRQMFFPLRAPLGVAPGDAIEVELRILPAAGMYSWDVRVLHDGREARAEHSTLRGLLLTRDDLRRTDPIHRPTRSPEAEAHLTVLRLCDGGHTLREIEQALFAEHHALFPSLADAATFVAGVLARE